MSSAERLTPPTSSQIKPEPLLPEQTRGISQDQPYDHDGGDPDQTVAAATLPCGLDNLEGRLSLSFGIDGIDGIGHD
jgi:hypothetical protein